jgi:beta-barrel assembly-enhancing protease
MISNAVFFDGLSSAPQKIELILDEISGELVFESIDNKRYKWSVDKAVFEHFGNKLNIHYGKYPIQLIKIENADFISNLKLFLGKNGHIGWYQKIMNFGIKAYLAIALLILGLIILTYLVVIPWVGEKAVFLIPEEYDNTIGQSFLEEYLKHNSIDTAKTNALNLFAKQLTLKNTKKIHFTVIKSSTINAFALPDGSVIIFSGIIDSMRNYDELAGLIGHEVSHINNRHSMKMICRNLSGYIFISAVLSDVNGIMAVIGDNLNSLQLLSYSRNFERQADYEGLDIMKINRINPEGMINLFKRLQSNKDVLMPEFLSTHPITTERINSIKAIIRKNSFPIADQPKLRVLFKELKR